MLEGTTAFDFPVRSEVSMTPWSTTGLFAPARRRGTPSTCVRRCWSSTERTGNYPRRRIPRPGTGTGLSYQLIIASQPYRARTSVEQKMSTVIVPLARVLAPGGRMVVVHSHGDDPGLEIRGLA